MLAPGAHEGVQADLLRLNLDARLSVPPRLAAPAYLSSTRHTDERSMMSVMAT